MSKVPILIPAYNAESTLVQTLQSIADQPREYLERVDKILLVDDCSSDGTISSAIQYWKLGNPRLEVVSNQINRGERAVCNLAFRQLLRQGCTWCLVLHADDLAKPNWLQAFFCAADQDIPNIVSIGSSWDDLYEDGRVVLGDDQPGSPCKVFYGSSESFSSALRDGCWWHFSGCAVHLPRFNDVGYFDERMPQLGDLDWLLRAYKSGFDFLYIPQTLIYYRNSSTASVSSVSYRINRDLSESALIASKLLRDDSVRHVTRLFIARLLSVSARRAVTRFAQFRFSSSWSAFLLSLRFVSLLAKSYVLRIQR